MLRVKNIIVLGVVLSLAACGSGSPGNGQNGSNSGQSLPLWQSVGLMLDLPEDEAEQLVTRVLARHNTVASDENVKHLMGAALVFRDQDHVDPKRTLNCMDSGVQSPTGSAWQDTIAWCVTELAN